MTKQRQILTYFLLLTILTTLSFVPRTAGSSTSKLEKGLASKIAKDSKKRYTALLILDDNKRSVFQKTGSGASDRKTAISQLKKESQLSQQDLKSYLKNKQSAGKVSKFKPFWIVNAVFVEAQGSEIVALSNRPDVQMAIENKSIPIPGEPKKGKGYAKPSAAGIEWNIAKIEADKVWTELGFDGTGVRIGILDSGVDKDHPDLAGKVLKAGRLNADGSVTDITANSSDALGHGTHVAGIAVGGNASGSSIGVAPESELIVGQLGITDWSLSKVISGMQWIIDPDNNPATDDGAHVVNMSFGDASIPHYFDPIDRMIGLNVVPVAASGNSGLGFIGAPASVPSAFSSGATNLNDVVPYWSSGGIVEWNEAPYVGKWMKPEVSAPGVQINSAMAGLFKWMEGSHSWGSMDGTSMAAPHVAGVAALVKQANPSLTADQIKKLLEVSSVDLGLEGKDVRYGAGRINAKKAVGWALTLGKIKGTVKSASGTSLKAMIKIASLEAIMQTSGNGSFDSVLPEGTYNAVVSSYGYIPKTVSIDITKDETTIQPIVLQASSKYTLSGKITKQGTQISVPGSTVKITGVKGAKTITSSSGYYSLKLPLGDYSVEVSHPEYEKLDVGITITGNLTKNIGLKKKPDILLVDDNDGYWDSNADSYAGFYKSALDSLGKKHTLWRIWDESSAEGPAIPKYSDLKNYKTVIWTSDSYPSYMSDYGWDDEEDTMYILSNPLIKFLQNKGSLLLSGQDLAYYNREDYDNFLQNYLDTDYVSEPAKNFSIAGTTPGLFKDFNFKIFNTSGDSGANNQYHQDVIRVVEGRAKPALIYTADARGYAGASIQTDKYKAIFFAFGFEGISSLASRKAVMRRSIDWLQKDTIRPTVGLSGKLSGGTYVRGTLSSKTRISDNVGIKDVKLFIDGKYVRTLARPYNVTLDTRKYKNGKRTVKLVARDIAGNTASKSARVYFDNRKPLVSFTNIVAGQQVSRKPAINVVVKDNLFASKAFLNINSKRYALKKVSPTTFTMNWDTVDLKNGKYELKAVAYDKAGNMSAAKSYVFLKNGLLPIGAIAIPKDFSPNRDGIADETLATFKLSKQAKVNVSVLNYKGIVKTLFNGYLVQGVHYFKWDGTNSLLQPVPNGGYIIKVTASDESKASAAQTVVNVKNPSVEITNLTASPNPFSPNNDGANDVAHISYKLSANAAVTVQISNYKGVVRTLINAVRQSGQNTVSWNGKNGVGVLMPNGVYLCTVTAKDDNNAVDTEKVTIEIAR